MIQITDQIAAIEARIGRALARSGRAGETVKIVAVSKRQPASAIATARAAGLTHFGENYLQEALEKISAVDGSGLDWHFIGRIQSNKTRSIAENFSWVQTVDRKRIADRLNDQRPDNMKPLNILIQLNLDHEPQKGGIRADEILPLAEHIDNLPMLRLRGVMGMPPANLSPAETLASFSAIAAESDRLKREGFAVDTISMGMSADFEHAIERGSNCVRLGTALFGPRSTDAL